MTPAQAALGERIGALADAAAALAPGDLDGWRRLRADASCAILCLADPAGDAPGLMAALRASRYLWDWVEHGLATAAGLPWRPLPLGP